MTVAAVKVCRECGIEKPAEEFYANLDKRTQKTVLSAACRPCQALRLRRWRREASANGWHIRKTYGITIEQYDEMLARQGGVCAICEGEETRTMKGTILALCVDHDHETGQIRGLLCHYCNMLLGFAQDDPERLAAAVRYLQGG